MRSSHCRFGAAIVFGLLACSAASAADWSIVLNGRAFHVNASEDWNESNWGLGFEREFDTESRWVKVVLGNAFIDSQDDLSYMAGAGIKRRFRPGSENDFYVDVGLIGFAMVREDVNRSEPFPGVLPVVTFGRRSIAVNLTYLPGSIGERITGGRLIDPTIDGVFFLQLKLGAGLFGPRTRSTQGL